MKEERHLRWWQYAAFYIIFWLVWAAFTLGVKPILEKGSPWTAEIVQEICKCIIWIVPALYLIHMYSGDLEISPKEMFSAKIPVIKLVPWLLIMIAVPMWNAHRANGAIAVHPDFHLYSLIGGFLTVGITEEIVFRGWLYNVTLKKLPSGYAEILNAVLFLLIHIPIWILQGKLVSNIASGSWVSIVILSYLFSWIFKETRNLWVSIILHMTWDLMVILLMG